MAPPTIPDPLRLPTDAPDGLFFLISSDLQRYKGIEVALKALAQIQARKRPHLVICGRPLESDYAETLRRQSIEAGIDTHVQFRGATAHDEVLALMRKASGCLIPSRFENQSRVPVEAMASGTPVVASRIASFLEACGDAAVYHSVDDAEVLAGHMMGLMERPSWRDELIRAGRARIQTMTPGSASEAILEAVEKLLG